MLENMDVERLESLPAKTNPFRHDLHRIGTRLGKNVVAMYEDFVDEHQKYIILVNTDTGERLKVTMPKEITGA